MAHSLAGTQRLLQTQRQQSDTPSTLLRNAAPAADLDGTRHDSTPCHACRACRGWGRAQISEQKDTGSVHFGGRLGVGGTGRVITQTVRTIVGPHWSHTERLADTTNSTYCMATGMLHVGSRRHVHGWQFASAAGEGWDCSGTQLTAFLASTAHAQRRSAEGTPSTCADTKCGRRSAHHHERRELLRCDLSLERHRPANEQRGHLQGRQRTA